MVSSGDYVNAFLYKDAQFSLIHISYFIHKQSRQKLTNPLRLPCTDYLDAKWNMVEMPVFRCRHHNKRKSNEFRY
jgi:hypothetical protein